MAPPNAHSENQTDLSIIHCHYWIIFFFFGSYLIYTVWWSSLQSENRI